MCLKERISVYGQDKDVYLKVVGIVYSLPIVYFRAEAY